MHAALSVALQGQRIATPGARTPAPQTAQPTPGAPHPIGPSSSPLRPFGLVCGCALACARTSWRSQAPARGCLRKLRANPRLLLRYADPTECALGVLLLAACSSCRQCVRTRGCPPMHCVKARPIQRHVIASVALACRGTARWPEIYSAHPWPRRTGPNRSPLRRAHASTHG